MPGTVYLICALVVAVIIYEFYMINGGGGKALMDEYEKAAVAWIVTLYITLSIFSYFASAGILYLACKVCSLDVWSWKLSTIVWIMMWLFKPSSIKRRFSSEGS